MGRSVRDALANGDYEGTATLERTSDPGRSQLSTFQSARPMLAGRKESMAGFALGRLLATPGVLQAANGENLLPYLARHTRGDWGDVDESDRRANTQALVDGTRLMSAYRLANGARIWIITEADRSATTVLLPEEY